MAVLQEQTCPICLLADELGTMVPVDVPVPRFKESARVVLCRSCAWAIARAVKSTGELPPLGEGSEGVDHD